MIQESAKELFNCLADKNLTLAMAESCTGGLAAKLITDIPGSSAVFLGSVVSYSNKLKTNILHVSEKTISAYGAVSIECAYEMATGIKKITGADIAISATGIAGPVGGISSDKGEKPVGLVYVGISCKNKTRVFKLNLIGDRNSVRNKTVSFAFNKAREIINSENLTTQ